MKRESNIWLLDIQSIWLAVQNDRKTFLAHLRREALDQLVACSV